MTTEDELVQAFRGMSPWAQHKLLRTALAYQGHWPRRDPNAVPAGWHASQAGLVVDVAFRCSRQLFCDTKIKEEE